MQGGHKDKTPLAFYLLLGCLALFFAWFVRAGLGDAGDDSRITSYDLHSFFLPKFAYGSRELFHGRFPLWNPYEDGGVPFFATAQPSVLYPPKAFLFWLLPTLSAYWVYLGLHYVALAVGFFYFLEEQGIEGEPAFAGAAVWTFAIPLLESNYHPTRIANLAFLPFVFLLVERFAKKPTARYFAALATLVGLQFFAGYPGYVLDTALLVGLHLLVRHLGHRDTGFLPVQRTLPLVALAFALGTALAAVQLLPLLEASVVARRAGAEAVASGPLSVVPASLAPAWLVSVPGLLVFSILGLFDRRALAPAAGLFACTFLGQGGWLLLQRVPGFSIMRFPYLWLHLAPFYVAWLVALGVDTFRGLGARKDARARVHRGAVLAMSLAWALFCAVALFRRVTGAGFATAFFTRLGRNATTPMAALWGVAGAVGLALLCSSRARAALGPRALFAVVALLVLSHEASYPFGAFTAPIRRPSGKGEMSRYTRSMGLQGRAFSWHDLYFGYPITDRMPSALGAEESFLSWRFRRIIERFELWPLFGHFDWQGFGVARPFLDVLDVQYVAVPGDYAGIFGDASGLPLIRSNGDSALFENTGHMGHAFVLHAARVVDSPEDALEAVLSPDFEPRREVILESPSASRHLPAALPGVATNISYPVGERRTSPEKMEYALDLPRPGMLVVSESDYPGWKAFVDGHAAKIETADYAFRGVALPEGRHTVRFEYRPSAVAIGAVVSLLGLLGIFLSGNLWRVAGRSKRD